VVDNIETFSKMKDLMNKDLLVDAKKSETKIEIGDRREKYVLDHWRTDFPEHEALDYATIISLGAVTKQVAEWLSARDAEFNSTLNFPDWAGQEMTLSEVEKVREKLASINTLNRETAMRKNTLAKNVKSINKRIDEVHDSKLAELMENDEKLFILTYPKDRLPISYALRSIAFANELEACSEEMLKEMKLAGKISSSREYDASILEEWKKAMWVHVHEGGKLKQFISEHGVDFYIPTISVGEDHLSGITSLLEKEAIFAKPTGIRR